MPLQAEWQSIHITQVRTNPSFNNQFLPQNYDERVKFIVIAEQRSIVCGFETYCLVDDMCNQYGSGLYCDIINQ